MSSIADRLKAGEADPEFLKAAGIYVQRLEEEHHTVLKGILEASDKYKHDQLSKSQS